ncbi:MAG: general secretion pathway protein GspF, partial [Gammaproteobacteria bacterium]|nr:general secretion pathway protein GspF [Gammaproteobacteria bacterium]
RRELLSAGFMGASGLVMAPAWLAALLKPGKAGAAIALDSDIGTLATGTTQCDISLGAGLVPFICFDLAGGANLVGSEVIVGVQGGQANFLSTAGYGKMGVPGNMVPSSAGFVSNALGLLWHSDGAILRGILSKATTPATAAGTNGAVFPALSENDTNINPHNPMYGIANVGASGSLLTLVGTEPTISGGNSMAPPSLGGVPINSALQPSTIDRPSDAVGLVSSGTSADELSVAVQESQARISSGTTPYSAGASDPASAFTGVLTEPNTGTGTPGVQLYTDPPSDAQLKNQVRCNYVKAAYNSANFGNPSDLDPRQDANITGGGTPIFTASDFSDSDVAMTATVMKLVLNGYAGAGTISIGGFDYHDNTR